MEPLNKSADGFWEQQQLWEEADTSELSPSVSVNLSLDVLPEKDIMSIVMKRKIGGTSCSVVEHGASMTPAKKLKTGELDSNVDDRDTVEFPSDRDHVTVAPFKCLDSNIFTEMDSCSATACCNEFTIQTKSNLQTLYSEGNDGGLSQNCDGDVTRIKDVESFIETEVSMKKPNSTLLQCKDTDNKLLDSITDEHDNKEIGKITTELELNSFTSGDEFTKEKINEISEPLKNRSDLECFKIHSSSEEFSQTEGKSIVEKTRDVQAINAAKIYEKEPDIEAQKKIEVDHFVDIDSDQKDREEKIKLADNIDRDINKKRGSVDTRHWFNHELCQNDHNESVASDEVDSLTSCPVVGSQTKIDNKKSRKQYTPKRLPKSSAVYDTIDPQNHCIELPNEVKSGKSRKQNIPKRVIKESDTAGSYYDDGKFDDSDDSDGELSDGIENSIYKNQPLSQEDPTIECYGEFDESSVSESCEGNEFENTDDIASVTSCGNVVPTHLVVNTSSLGLAEPHAVPPHLQTALKTYTNKVLQFPDQNDLNLKEILGQEQSGLTENLEVVKKLREIRFNRYRKITVEEKREIAEYAKFNGVSSAAMHFGVSKSAVSMWSRINFDTFEEERNKKKRHCMTGNPKFEELIQRVRNEKANKFKWLSRDDKFEVSRYAKLIGVREMARCLDIALGTVSGWMRQFPYLIKSTNQEVTSENQTDQSQKASNNGGLCEPKQDATGESCKNKTMKAKRDLTPKHVEQEDCKVPNEHDDDDLDCYQITNKNNLATVTCSQPSNNQTAETENRNDLGVIEGNLTGKPKNKKRENRSMNCQTAEKKKDLEMTKSEVDNADEIDEMIAESYETPDVDKCFEDAKELIKGSLLENDTFFEKLFKRVVECRSDKYKSLKASEKLEVVRYAKRIGVRRIAKILGLATGTLSGWTTKYQAHLGLTSEGIMDVGLSDASFMSELDSSLNTSLNSSVSPEIDCNFQNESQNSQQSSPSPFISPSSSLLDNPEKAEVTAVKLILKDRFEFLRDKIDIARKIKFRNITHSEKIEVVKCTKLAGIRPTARVLNMPIGTLSGWITKYTGNLPAVYQEECNKLAGTSVHRPPPSDGDGMPGSQDYIFKLMNSQWPGIHHLSALYTNQETDAIKQQNIHEIIPLSVSDDFNHQSQQSLSADNLFEPNMGTSNAGRDHTNIILDSFHEQAKNIAQEYLESLKNKTGIVGK